MALVTDFGRQMECYLEDNQGKVELMSLIKEMSPSKMDSGNSDVQWTLFEFIYIGIHLFPRIALLVVKLANSYVGGVYAAILK